MVDSYVDCLRSSTATFTPHQVPTWFGTQRARFRVDAPAEVAVATLHWRRHDNPPRQAAVIVARESGVLVRPAALLNVTRESALVVFSAKVAATYFVYWLPHRPDRGGGVCIGECRACNTPSFDS